MTTPLRETIGTFLQTPASPVPVRTQPMQMDSTLLVCRGCHATLGSRCRLGDATWWRLARGLTLRAFEDDVPVFGPAKATDEWSIGFDRHRYPTGRYPHRYTVTTNRPPRVWIVCAGFGRVASHHATRVDRLVVRVAVDRHERQGMSHTRCGGT